MSIFRRAARSKNLLADSFDELVTANSNAIIALDNGSPESAKMILEHALDRVEEILMNEVTH